MRKNKYKFEPSVFTPHEIVKLYQQSVLTVGEARRMLGIDGDDPNDTEETALDISQIIHYRDVGIISVAEAREFLGIKTTVTVNHPDGSKEIKQI